MSMQELRSVVVESYTTEGRPEGRPSRGHHRGHRVLGPSAELVLDDSNVRTISKSPRPIVWKHGVTLDTSSQSANDQRREFASIYESVRPISTLGSNIHPASIRPQILSSKKSGSRTIAKRGNDLRREMPSAESVGKIVLLGSGQFERQEPTGTALWLEREALWESSLRKLHSKLDNDTRFESAVNVFLKYRAINVLRDVPMDCVTRAQFQDALQSFGINMTIAERKEVARRVDENNTDRINARDAMRKLRLASSSAAADMSSPAPPGSQSQSQQEDPQVRTGRGRRIAHPSRPKRRKGPSKAEPAQAVGHLETGPRAGEGSGPLIVFIVGWILCPVWCLGCWWCSRASAKAKFWGRLSVTMSIISSLIGIGVGFGLSWTTYSPPPISIAHCPVLEGLMVSIKASGPSASESVFWNPTTFDRSYQIRLKNGINDLCSKEALKNLEPQSCEVILDEIKDIFEDPDKASLVIVFRIVTKKKSDAEFLQSLVPAWLSDGLLQQALLKQLIVFDNIWPYNAAPSFLLGPPKSASVFRQTRIGWADWSEEWAKLEWDSLLREAPRVRDSNVLNPNDPGWAASLQSFLQTCWFVHLVQMGPLEGANLDKARTLQLVLQTNQTEENAFFLWARMSPAFTTIDLANLNFAMVPAPNWLMDATASVGAAVRGKPVRDLVRCGDVQVVDKSLCPITYLLEVDIEWPGKSYWWIGVTGQTSKAQFLPFTLLTKTVLS